MGLSAIQIWYQIKQVLSTMSRKSCLAFLVSKSLGIRLCCVLGQVCGWAFVNRLFGFRPSWDTTWIASGDRMKSMRRHCIKYCWVFFIRQSIRQSWCLSRGHYDTVSRCLDENSVWRKSYSHRPKHNFIDPQRPPLKIPYPSISIYLYP